MSLTFTGTLGIDTEDQTVPNTWFTHSGRTITQWTTTGALFTVTDPIVVKEIKWALLGFNALFGIALSAPTIKVGIWDSDGTLLTSIAVALSTKGYSVRIREITLFPGQTYTIAALCPPGTVLLTESTLNTTTVGHMTFGNSTTVINDSTFQAPADDGVTNKHSGIFGIKYAYDKAVTQSVPPDPVITPGGKQFIVTILTSWMPTDAKEWTLQASQSSDGINWLDWYDVTTLPIGSSTYSHSDRDPFDKPFYRYRYKIATATTQSDWSEIAYPGQVLNYVVATPDDTVDPNTIAGGTIDPSHLNVTELSAITANVGTLTAGIIRGPRVETSATNPRIAMEQNIGFYAKDASGADTFRLDALTGAATFAGSLTGSSFATGATDPRVVMDSTGIFSKNAAHADTFRVDAATGNVTLTGVLTSTAGSVIQGGHIAADTITATQIAANAITTSELNALSVTAAKIVANTITAAQIAADTITATEIAASAITTSELAALSVTAAKIAANTITAGQIAADTITATEIAANAITTSELNALAVTAGKIAANTITAGQIAAGTITSTEIASATITGADIASSTITASNITVVNLSSLSANLGTITAGTVTGATIQTATTGARVLLNTSGITAFDAASAQVLNFDTTTGNLTLKGTVQTGSSVPASTVIGTLGATNIPQLGGWNLLNNASFGDGTGALHGWISGGVLGGSLVTVTTPLKYGAKTLAFQPNGASAGNSVQVSNFTTFGSLTTAQNLVPIEEGKTYTASAWFRFDPANARTAPLARIRLMTYLEDGATNVGTQYSADTPITSTGWTRVTNTYTIPTGSSITRLRILFYPDFTVSIPVSTELYYVSGPQIEEGVVATAYTPKADEILPGTVGTNELSALSVTAAKIAANTITASQIASATITATQIAADTITATQIAANAITTSELNAGAVTAAKITAGTITTTEIAANTIVAGNIAATTITGAKIAANTIAAGNLVANTITAGQILAGTITSTEIAANTITAADIAANTITAGQIAATSITADRLNVSTLSAITANLGTITAGTITGTTITGATIQSSTSNPKVVLDSSGVKSIDSTGVDSLRILSSTSNGAIDIILPATGDDQRAIRWISTGTVPISGDYDSLRLLGYGGSAAMAGLISLAALPVTNILGATTNFELNSTSSSTGLAGSATSLGRLSITTNNSTDTSVTAGGFGKTHIELSAENNGSTNYARLTLHSETVTGNATPSIQVNTPASSAVILDYGNKSGFLRLNDGTTSGRSATGLTTITCIASATQTFTITHNFGISGANGIFSGRAGGTASHQITGIVTGSTTNTVSVSITDTAGTAWTAGQTQNVVWLIWTP